MGLFLFYFNIARAFILLIPWVLRWVFYPNQAVADLNHHITTQFYPTIGVGFMLIGMGMLVYLQNVIAGFVFWFAGTLLTIFFAILIPLIVFEGKHVQLDHINPAWFIPPVALIVIPAGGSLFLSYFNGLRWELLIVLNYFSWGAGFFLWLSLLAITFYRFILHHLGAYVLASNTLAKFFNLYLVDYIGYALFWLLVIFWSLTFLNSFKGIYTLKLFK
ncbi:hypothetical protein H5T88_03655 [bacterium]|nr:hypothetical protein [bacterium]